MTPDFIYGDGHRWYTDPNKCPHYNANVCASCDFDGYYANTYPSVPWREIHPDDESEGE